MHMVPRTYVVRTINDHDRAEHARHVAQATARGDLEQVEIYSDGFAEWEQEQGVQRERLACPVCGDSWLVPTRDGRSRPHSRRDSGAQSLGPCPPVA